MISSPPPDCLFVHPEAETPPDVQTLVRLLSFSGDDLKKKRRTIPELGRVQDGSKQQTGPNYETDSQDLTIKPWKDAPVAIATGGRCSSEFQSGG